MMTDGVFVSVKGPSFSRSTHASRLAPRNIVLPQLSCPANFFGQVSVADGTPLAAMKLERVLANDPGMGVIRHCDAGYDHALEMAQERDVRIPMLEGTGA